MDAPIITAATPRSVTYTASAGQTAFPIPYAYFAEADNLIEVWRDGARVAAYAGGDGDMSCLPATNASVIAGVAGTATIPACEEGDDVTVYAATPAEREVDFSAAGVKGANVDREFNRRVAVETELQAEISRAVRAPRGAAGPELPSPPPTGASVIALAASGALIAMALLDLGGLTPVHASWQDTLAAPPWSKNVQSFGCTGVDDPLVDDTAAFKKAAAGGGWIYVPPGTYRVDIKDAGVGCYLESNTHFFGAGEESIIKPFTATARGAIGCDSGAADAFVTDLSFRKLKFVGAVETDGFYEFAHLLNLNGVKRALVEDCIFDGMRGDGLYVGSGISGGAERHNHAVTVRRCRFDGKIKDNRNGVSVIDVDGMLIDDCDFANLSKSTMPGSVDFEPDASHGVIKNVVVRNNRFSNCDGNRGHVTFAVDNIPAANFSNIEVCGNVAEGCRAFICMYTNAIVGTSHQRINFHHNNVGDIQYLLEAPSGSLNGLALEGGACVGTTSGRGRILIGDGTTTTWTSKNIRLAGVDLTSNVSIPIAITNNSEHVEITGMKMRGATQAHMRLGMTGTATSYYNVHDNDFEGSPSNGVCQHDASTPNALTNTYRNNKVPVGVAQTFGAFNTDVSGALNAYTSSAAPSSFPAGESVAVWGSANSPDATTSGVVVTRRPFTADYTGMEQRFRPTYDASNKRQEYYRRAVNASTWDSWRSVDALTGDNTLGSGSSSLQTVLGRTRISRGSNGQLLLSIPGLTSSYGANSVGHLEFETGDDTIVHGRVSGLTYGPTAGGLEFWTRNAGVLASRWKMEPGDGSFLPVANNAYDLGAASNRVRVGYVYNLSLRPSASRTPAANGDLEIEATSNTTLTLKYRGSDGTVRAVALTLA